MKFGGTSVADAESVSRVVDIIEEQRRVGNEIAVVVSAQRGVTDQLIAIATEIANSRSAVAIEPFIQSLRQRHQKVLAEVGGE
ncbi:MAG: aspartate kinase, partial [Methanoregulaceae archaeon]|nr:aspartate kinase [Methanoregulaceae archaeon]